MISGVTQNQINVLYFRLYPSMIFHIVLTDLLIAKFVILGKAFRESIAMAGEIRR
jgi:hypothetical protein